MKRFVEYTGIRKKADNSGFTIVEMLLVVALLVILMGFGFYGGREIYLNTKQSHLDKRAEAIYYAAQSRMMEIYVTEDEEAVKTLTENTNVSSAGNGICYVSSNDAGTNDVLLSDHSLSMELEGADSNWVIEYNKVSLDVYSVTFSDKAEDYYATKDYGQDAIRSADPKVRRDAYKAQIGYFSTDAGTTVTSTQETTNRITAGAWLINEKDLTGVVRVYITKDLYESGKSYDLKLTVNSATSDAAGTDKHVTISGGKLLYKNGTSYAPLSGETIPSSLFVAGNNTYIFTGKIILDSLSDDENDRFNKIATASAAGDSAIVPGDNIFLTVQVNETGITDNKTEVRTSNAARSNIENSLFASYYNENGKNTAEIIYPRQLQNLSYKYSKVDSGAIGTNGGINAVLLNDIEWDVPANWKDNAVHNFVPISTDTGTGKIDSFTGKPVDQSAKTAGGNWAAKVLENDNCYTISGLKVDETGDGGLFGTLTASGTAAVTVSDVILRNPAIKATGNAGALAGSISNTEVKNVLAFNGVKTGTAPNTTISTTTADTALEISGGANVGGLIGKANGGKILGSVAALYVKGGSSAGGLVGDTDGVAIECCSAGGHTVTIDNAAGAYGTETTGTAKGRVNVVATGAAGGFIGKESGTIKDSYSTCSTSGSSMGGFIGSASGGTVSGCYGIGQVMATSTANAGGLVGSGSPAFSGQNYYYQLINWTGSGYLTALGGGAADADGVVIALDKKLTAADTVGTSYEYNKAASVALPASSFASRDDSTKKYDTDLPSIFSFKTVSDLAGASADNYYFAKEHYGDWPIPETIIKNGAGTLVKLNSHNNSDFYPITAHASKEDNSERELAQSVITEPIPENEVQEAADSEQNTEEQQNAEGAENSSTEEQNSENTENSENAQEEGSDSSSDEASSSESSSEEASTGDGSSSENASDESQGDTSSEASGNEQENNSAEQNSQENPSEENEQNQADNSDSSDAQNSADSSEISTSSEDTSSSDDADKAENNEESKENDETEEEEEPAEGTIESSEGDIAITFGKEAGIPEGATLEITEIDENSDEYARYVSDAMQALDAEDKDVVSFRVVDITIQKDGEEIQPQAEVGVEIKSEETYETDEISTVHMTDEEPEVLPTETETEEETGESTISFSTDSFSVYVIVQNYVEKTVTAEDGNVYKVTVNYDNTSGIPSDAELVVSEITEGTDEYDDVVGQSADEIGVLSEYFNFAKAFDISFVSSRTGEHYQPTKSVSVSIELLQQEINEENNISIVHFGDETDVIEPSVNGDALEFSTESFSKYVVLEVMTFDKIDESLNNKQLYISNGGNYLKVTDSGGEKVLDASDATGASAWKFELDGDGYVISNGGYYLRRVGDNWKLTDEKNRASVLVVSAMNGHHLIFDITAAKTEPKKFLGYYATNKFSDVLTMSDNTKLMLGEAAGDSDLVDGSLDGKEFYVSYNGWFMRNNNDERMRTTSPKDATKWQFTKVAGGYQIHKGNDYVGRNVNNNKGTRTTAASAITFTVSDMGDYHLLTYVDSNGKTWYFGYDSPTNAGHSFMFFDSEMSGTHLMLFDKVEVEGTYMALTESDGNTYALSYDTTASQFKGKLVNLSSGDGRIIDSNEDTVKWKFEKVPSDQTGFRYYIRDTSGKYVKLSDNAISLDTSPQDVYVSIRVVNNIRYYRFVNSGSKAICLSSGNTFVPDGTVEKEESWFTLAQDTSEVITVTYSYENDSPQTAGEVPVNVPSDESAASKSATYTLKTPSQECYYSRNETDGKIYGYKFDGWKIVEINDVATGDNTVYTPRHAVTLNASNGQKVKIQATWKLVKTEDIEDKETFISTNGYYLRTNDAGNGLETSIFIKDCCAPVPSTETKWTLEKGFDNELNTAYRLKIGGKYLCLNKQNKWELTSNFADGSVISDAASTVSGITYHQLYTVKEGVNYYIGLTQKATSGMVVGFISALTDASSDMTKLLFLPDRDFSGEFIIYCKPAANNANLFALMDYAKKNSNTYTLGSINISDSSKYKFDENGVLELNDNNATLPVEWTIEKALDNNGDEIPQGYYIKVYDATSSAYKYLTISDSVSQDAGRHHLTIESTPSIIYITPRLDGKVQLSNEKGALLNFTGNVANGFQGYDSDNSVVDRSWITFTTVNKTKRKVIYKYKKHTSDTRTSNNLPTANGEDSTVTMQIQIKNPDSSLEDATNGYSYHSDETDGTSYRYKFKGWRIVNTNTILQPGATYDFSVNNEMVLTVESVWTPIDTKYTIKYVIEDKDPSFGNFVTTATASSFKDLVYVKDIPNTADSVTKTTASEQITVQGDYEVRSLNTNSYRKVNVIYDGSKVKQNDYHGYTFKGWKPATINSTDPNVLNKLLTGDDEIDLLTYADNSDTVVLKAVWTNTWKTGGGYPYVNFSIWKDADAAGREFGKDELLIGLLNEGLNNYAPHVSGGIMQAIDPDTGEIVSADELPAPASGGNKYFMLSYLNMSVAKVDKIIRNQMAGPYGYHDNGSYDNSTRSKYIEKQNYTGNNSGTEYYWHLSYIPTDEEVLDKLKTMVTNGSTVLKESDGNGGTRSIPAEELTTDNFVIRWYSVKYQSVTNSPGYGFHIDGKLTRKVGYTSVTKTFDVSSNGTYSGGILDAEDKSLVDKIIAALRNKFIISMDEIDAQGAVVSNGDKKRLIIGDETKRANQIGGQTRDYNSYRLSADDKAYYGLDAGIDAYYYFKRVGNTYTWVIPSTIDTTYKVVENNYVYNDTGNGTKDRVSVEYTIDHDETTRKKWQEDTVIRTTVGPEDDDPEDMNTVDFYNIYSPETEFKILKVDDKGNAIHFTNASNTEVRPKFKVYKGEPVDANLIKATEDSSNAYSLTDKGGTKVDYIMPDDNGLVRVNVPLPTTAAERDTVYTFKEIIPEGYNGYNADETKADYIEFRIKAKVNDDNTLAGTFDVIKASVFTKASTGGYNEKVIFDITRSSNPASTVIAVNNTDATLPYNIKIVNSKGLDIAFSKIDGDGQKLGGAEFTLYDASVAANTFTNVRDNAGGIVAYDSILTNNGATTTDKIVSETTDSATNAVGLDGNKVTGNISFKVAPGVYYMKETKAPDGYEPDYYVKSTDDQYDASTHKAVVYKLIVGSDNVATEGAAYNLMLPDAKKINYTATTSYLLLKLKEETDAVDPRYVFDHKSTLQVRGIMNKTKDSLRRYLFKKSPKLYK